MDWAEHQVVVRGGRVYDALAGSGDLPIYEFRGEELARRTDVDAVATSSWLPGYLLDSVVGFGGSPEFETVAEFQDLPVVICGALGSFLARLQREAEDGDLDAAGRKQLESAYRAIEAMASSEDPEVQNALQVEIFETLSDGSDLWEAIRANLCRRRRLLRFEDVGDRLTCLVHLEDRLSQARERSFSRP